MPKLYSPQTPLSDKWSTLTQTHMSVLQLFFFFAVPLSVLPPVMLYYAGVTYGGRLLPELSAMQLQLIGMVFFLTELAMTFLVAYVVQGLAEWVDSKPAFEDAYKLAVVVPMPLWLVPLLLFIPSFIVNLTAMAAALILSSILIYYSVPAILKVKERGHAILLSGSILSAGMVAWALMMYITLLTWNWISVIPAL